MLVVGSGADFILCYVVLILGENIKDEKSPPSYCEVEETRDVAEYLVDPPPQYEDVVAMKPSEK